MQNNLFHHEMDELVDKKIQLTSFIQKIGEHHFVSQMLIQLARKLIRFLLRESITSYW